MFHRLKLVRKKSIMRTIDQEIDKYIEDFNNDQFHVWRVARVKDYFPMDDITKSYQEFLMTIGDPVPKAELIDYAKNMRFLGLIQNNVNDYYTLYQQNDHKAIRDFAYKLYKSMSDSISGSKNKFVFYTEHETGSYQQFLLLNFEPADNPVYDPDQYTGDDIKEFIRKCQGMINILYQVNPDSEFDSVGKYITFTDPNGNYVVMDDDYQVIVTDGNDDRPESESECKVLMNKYGATDLWNIL